MSLHWYMIIIVIAIPTGLFFLLSLTTDHYRGKADWSRIPGKRWFTINSCPFLSFSCSSSSECICIFVKQVQWNSILSKFLFDVEYVVVTKLSADEVQSEKETELSKQLYTSLCVTFLFAYSQHLNSISFGWSHTSWHIVPNMGEYWIQSLPWIYLIERIREARAPPPQKKEMFFLGIFPK